MSTTRCRWAFMLLALISAGGCGADDEGQAGGPSTGAGVSGGAGNAGAAGAAGGPGGGAGAGAGGDAGASANAGAGAAGASGGGAGSGTGGIGGGGVSGSAGGGGTSGNAGAGGTPGGDDMPMRLAITARGVPGGGEDHVCVTLALPNESAVWVKSIHATLTTGSHHLIVDRRPSGTALEEQPVQCSPTMGGDSSRLIIAQQPDTVLELPEGTAMRLEPHQPVFLQLHYINLTTSSADIEGTIELELFDASAGEPIEASSLFTGSMSISLPRGQEGSAEFFYRPPGSPARPVHVFALTSHTHSLGVESTIERVASESAPDTTPLHTSLDWHEPPLSTFDPPLAFTGQDGLRLRCQYLNDTDSDVGFGTRFEDEMCFMWLYYYEEP